MKKVLKTILKICKGYLIFDVICLAVVGVGEVMENIRNNPHKTIIENDQEVWATAIKKIKKWLFNK